MTESLPANGRAIAKELLAWRGSGASRYLNVADGDSKASCEIAAAWADRLRVTRSSAPREAEESIGDRFKHRLAAYLKRRLPRLAPGRSFAVAVERPITEFEQYRHLEDLSRLVEGDGSGTLRSVVGEDYVVRPDIVASLDSDGSTPFLHASISCKWTIRSDRVQNARHEAVTLIRHRKGRAPHIVVVTAEPLPSRLSSIAQGTGEIDCVYHLDLESLVAAAESAGNDQQRRTLGRLVDTRRLKDLTELPKTLMK